MTKSDEILWSLIDAVLDTDQTAITWMHIIVKTVKSGGHRMQCTAPRLLEI